MTERFNLRAARLNAGLTQRALSDAVDVRIQTLQRLEDGAGCHPANAKKIADFFGVQVTDLMPLERAVRKEVRQ